MSDPQPVTDTVIVHTCPTFYVQHRGWGQEVNTLHLELCDDPAMRYKATGKRTPLDPDWHLLTAHGSTPQEAVENFRRALETMPWQDYFSGIMRRIDNLTLDNENLFKRLAEKPA